MVSNQVGLETYNSAIDGCFTFFCASFHRHGTAAFLKVPMKGTAAEWDIQGGSKQFAETPASLQRSGDDIPRLRGPVDV